MFASCLCVYDRILELMPCQQWLWPVSQEDHKQPMLQATAQESVTCFPATQSMQDSVSRKYYRQTEGKCITSVLGVGYLMPASNSAYGVSLPSGKHAGRNDDLWEIDALHAIRAMTPRSDSACHSCTSQSSYSAQDASEVNVMLILFAYPFIISCIKSCLV